MTGCPLPSPQHCLFPSTGLEYVCSPCMWPSLIFFPFAMLQVVYADISQHALRQQGATREPDQSTVYSSVKFSWPLQKVAYRGSIMYHFCVGFCLILDVFGKHLLWDWELLTSHRTASLRIFHSWAQDVTCALWEIIKAEDKIRYKRIPQSNVCLPTSIDSPDYTLMWK